MEFTYKELDLIWNALTVREVYKHLPDGCRAEGEALSDKIYAHLTQIDDLAKLINGQ